jgi:hypothetical protein
MKLANPLYYPLAVLLGAIALVVGVRVANLPRLAMLPIAVGITAIGAAFLKAREPETFGLDSPELAQELQAVQQQARVLIERADTFRAEASRLLTDSGQVELLGVVQYACDYTHELPSKINNLAQRLQGSNSLFSVPELEQQLTTVEARIGSSSGVAQQQLTNLAASLRHNIQLARQGEDARQAQLVNLSTLIVDAASVLQTMQNKLRTADLTKAEDALALRSLSTEFKDAQDTVDLLT